jgi:hypothetical protein
VASHGAALLPSHSRLHHRDRRWRVRAGWHVMTSREPGPDHRSALQRATEALVDEYAGVHAPGRVLIAVARARLTIGRRPELGGDPSAPDEYAREVVELARDGLDARQRVPAPAISGTGHSSSR